MTPFLMSALTTSAPVFFMRLASSPTPIASGICTLTGAFLAISNCSFCMRSRSSARRLALAAACCWRCFLAVLPIFSLPPRVSAAAVRPPAPRGRPPPGGRSARRTCPGLTFPPPRVSINALLGRLARLMRACFSFCGAAGCCGCAGAWAAAFPASGAAVCRRRPPWARSPLPGAPAGAPRSPPSRSWPAHRPPASAHAAFSGTLKRSSMVAHWFCCVRYSKIIGQLPILEHLHVVLRRRGVLGQYLRNRLWRACRSPWPPRGPCTSQNYSW